MSVSGQSSARPAGLFFVEPIPALGIVPLRKTKDPPSAMCSWPPSAGLFVLKTEADFLEDATVGAAQHLSARRCALCQTKPDAGAGCPRSLAHLAVRWWLRSTKKMPRLGGTAPGQKHSL